MSKHTKGELHNHGLTIHIQNEKDGQVIEHTCIANMNEAGTAYGSVEKAREIDAQHIVKCWNAFEEGGLVDDLLAACKNSPAPNFFADFANFAEECLEKPSMAVYRNQFRALTTFLWSCTDRSEKILQAIAKAKQ